MGAAGFTPSLRRWSAHGVYRLEVRQHRVYWIRRKAHRWWVEREGETVTDCASLRAAVIFVGVVCEGIRDGWRPPTIS